MFSFHRCRVPRLALWGISLVRLSCVSSRMMLIIWKCLLIRRSRLRTSMWMLSKMNCLWSTFPRKNSSLEGCLSESSSLVFCAPWGTSTWRTSSLRLTSRDTLSVTMTPKKQEIAISESWIAELEKHPYHSSKISHLTHIEKPGTGIFLMKESSKLYRPHKEREKRKLTKRLGGPTASSTDSRGKEGA